MWKRKIYEDHFKCEEIFLFYREYWNKLSNLICNIKLANILCENVSNFANNN